ncbi:MAG: PilZ domain-containing protein [Oligoflexia bacterium]|nr:PilZ domain-containing protein [Oligoflexia bacterium]
MENQTNTTEQTETPAQRFNVELAFEIKRNYARQTNKAEVRNISLTGALVKTEQPLKLSEKIHVFLSVSGRTRKVVATVVWVGDKGAGLQFQPFNNRDLQIVDDIIYYATEKSSSNKDLLESILSKVA